MVFIHVSWCLKVQQPSWKKRRPGSTKFIKQKSRQLLHFLLVLDLPPPTLPAPREHPVNPPTYPQSFQTLPQSRVTCQIFLSSVAPSSSSLSWSSGILLNNVNYVDCLLHTLLSSSSESLAVETPPLVCHFFTTENICDCRYITADPCLPSSFILSFHSFFLFFFVRLT